MIDKEVDVSVVGHNVLSLLFSINLVRHSKNVLLVKDHRFNLGTIYSQFIGHFEYFFLKTWGKDHQLAPLDSLENFMQHKKLCFVIDDTFINLGGSLPSENYRELMRKLPELFLKNDGSIVSVPASCEEFDKDMFQFVERVAQFNFRFKSLQSLNVYDFVETAPVWIKELLRAFQLNILDKNTLQENPKIQTLLYMARGFYHQNLILSASQLEVVHLLTSLLLPVYSLDAKELSQELMSVFYKKGGQLRETSIREWSFYKNRPWSLELASFEGIVHPQKLCFFGAMPQNMPFEFGTDIDFYGGLKSSWRISGATNEYLKRVYLVSNSDLVGTHWPLNIVDLDKTLEFTQMTFLHKGLKTEFMTAKMDKDLESIRQKMWPELEFHRQENAPDINIEIMQKGKTSKKGTLEVPFLRKVDVHYLEGHQQKIRQLKDVHYFGPLECPPLGLFSTLMEIKDVVKFI